ncbi:hypothetical protein DVA67_007840 [Solirubrobacter sp. CPCC 204708]|nr:hypothetical protein [Solirubrobacter deserti]
MAWTLTTEELTAAVAEARAGAAERPTWRKLAMLARGLRWLDETAEASRVFQEAATDAIWRVEEHYGTGDGRSRTQTAGLFALAGDLETAREWGGRPLEELLQRREDIPIAVDTLYVCGESEGALALARQHGVDGPSVDLLVAERDGDVARCDAMIKRVTRAIVAERLEPTASSALYPLHQWDWLEVGFVVRAQLAGEPAPSHASMLERSGCSDRARAGASRSRSRAAWPASG